MSSFSVISRREWGSRKWPGSYIHTSLHLWGSTRAITGAKLSTVSVGSENECYMVVKLSLVTTLCYEHRQSVCIDGAAIQLLYWLWEMGTFTREQWVHGAVTCMQAVPIAMACYNASSTHRQQLIFTYNESTEVQTLGAIASHAKPTPQYYEKWGVGLAREATVLYKVLYCVYT